jgi:hypothetical protein
MGADEVPVVPVWARATTDMAANAIVAIFFKMFSPCCRSWPSLGGPYMRFDRIGVNLVSGATFEP